MAVSAVIDGRIATITFEKPPGNSYDRDFMDEFNSALDVVEDSPAGVLVIRSAIPNVFCYGADLKAFEGQSAVERAAMAAHANIVLNRLELMRAVSIAAISGHALGGGLEIALACDLRVLLTFLPSGKSTSIGLVETNVGMIPGTGGTQRLPRVIGTSRAFYHIATGKPIRAEDALAWGLVNQVFDYEDKFEEGVTKLTSELAERAPLALEAAKRAVSEPVDEAGLQFERDLVGKLFDSEDANEAFKAFAEKREHAPWTGS